MVRVSALPSARPSTSSDQLTITDSGSDKELATPWYSDQVLPFDITLSGANEYGAMCAAKIFGVEILNEGSGISIDDAVTEMPATFVARVIEPMSAVASPFQTRDFRPVACFGTIANHYRESPNISRYIHLYESLILRLSEARMPAFSWSAPGVLQNCATASKTRAKNRATGSGAISVSLLPGSCSSLLPHTGSLSWITFLWLARLIACFPFPSPEMWIMPALNPRQSPIPWLTHKIDPKHRSRVPDVCHIFPLRREYDPKDWPDHSPQNQLLADPHLYRSRSGSSETQVHPPIHSWWAAVRTDRLERRR